MTACEICGQHVGVNEDGKIRDHPRDDERSFMAADGQRPKQVGPLCDGSGQKVR